VQHFWPVSILPPDIGRVAGMLLVALGFVGFAGVLAFRRAGTSPNPWTPSSALVISGIYRWTRNPMYLGFTLLYLGISAWVDTLWPLLPLPIVLVVMRRGVVAREEAYLEARFGDEYRRYLAAVRRWI
jgi:protein-S-isoprenylcysteine O-methyltransferase Ste14